MMNSFEANGIAALLPGIGLVLQFVEGELNRMLQLVGQGSADQGSNILHPPLNQAPRTKQSLGGQLAWHNMTAKQKRARIAAMQRGRQVHQKVAQGKE